MRETSQTCSGNETSFQLKIAEIRLKKNQRWVVGYYSGLQPLGPLKVIGASTVAQGCSLTIPPHPKCSGKNGIRPGVERSKKNEHEKKKTFKILPPCLNHPRRKGRLEVIGASTVAQGCPLSIPPRPKCSGKNGTHPGVERSQKKRS